MNAWWFSLLLAAIVAGLLQSHRTLRLYFFAQLLNALAVFVAPKGWYLAAYICTTVPIIECCLFLLWDTGLTSKQFWVAVNFGLLMGILGAGRGHYVAFVEGVLLSTVGMAMALTTAGKREWVAIRTIGALSLVLSCYDFAFVRGWRETNSWLPSLMCSAAFLWLAGKQRGNYERTMQRNLEHQRR